MNKSGLNIAIATLIIILLAITSIIIVYNIIRSSINRIGGSAGLQQECFFINVRPISCTNTSDEVKLNVQLISGEDFSLIGMVEFEDGTKNVSEVPISKELGTTQIKIPKSNKQKPKTALISTVLKDSQENVFMCSTSSPINCQDNSLIDNEEDYNQCIDIDDDGWYSTPIGAQCGNQADCNDTNAEIHPNAIEICGNSIDEDCNNADEECEENNIQEIIDLKLSQAKDEFSKKEEVIQKKNTLQPWNNGADYAPTLQAQINNLPQEGGEIIIPAGKYKIKTKISIAKDNVTIKANNLGDVILESQDINDNMFSILNSYTTIENLILWGDKGRDVYAIPLFNANNNIVSNIIINFDFAILIGTKAISTKVYGNYLFDNGYYSIRVSGYNRIGTECQITAHDILLENNFLSDNYQGIALFCASNITIRNNTIRNSNISALRVETSDYNTIEQNMFYQNHLQGMWIYAFSDHNVFSDNIVIDNNKENSSLWFDCWTPQTSIKNDYINNRPGPVGYPYLRQENGNYIFTNYFCQFQGNEIELRNNVSSNLFYNNIIGRYSVLKDNLGWQSINDLKMSFFPMFYNVNRNFLSNNNNFTQNYFLNSKSERIMDQGCNNLYVENKLVTFNPLSVQDFTPVLNDTYQFHCRQEPTCNLNGVCDTIRGEQYSNCDADCPIISLGEKGSRQKRDVCAQGLAMTEAIFPARQGCNNIYDGSFYCTNKNSICEPQYGENYCNSLDCPSSL